MFFSSFHFHKKVWSKKNDNKTVEKTQVKNSISVGATPKQAFGKLRPGLEGATLCSINNVKLDRESI
jgi:hypothetical protein